MAKYSIEVCKKGEEDENGVAPDEIIGNWEVDEVSMTPSRSFDLCGETFSISVEGCVASGSDTKNEGFFRPVA